uniref:Lysosomal Pro-X carboxypeptidase n=1 Tax=Trichuris muris TaxID=70415 RepID=A0A5S6QIY8_TRIMR
MESNEAATLPKVGLISLATAWCGGILVTLGYLTVGCLTGFMWDNAEAFSAMLVFAEHRYYGKSLPFGNMSRNVLGKLSSSQALADFAVLISHLKSTFGGAAYLPVIAFGGSYGGMLAAWMRIKYPHLIDGAIAASAPVAQFPGLTPCSAFTDITTEVFRNTSSPCAVSISRSWSAIRTLGATTKGRRKLVDIFKLCNESDLAFKNNVTQLVNWLSDIYGTLAMVNYPYETDFLNPVPGWPVKMACNYLSDTKAASVELLNNIYKAVSVYLNYTGTVLCNKLESNYGSSVNAELWEYQTCTEMMMPMCNSEESMFEQHDWNETEFSQTCLQKFGVIPKYGWAVSNYGGRSLTDVTKIVFSNGWLDPWRGGGILSSDHGITSLIVEDGAHHYDLRGRHPKDTPSVLNVRMERSSCTSYAFRIGKGHLLDQRLSVLAKGFRHSHSFPVITDFIQHSLHRIC